MCSVFAHPLSPRALAWVLSMTESTPAPAVEEEEEVPCARIEGMAVDGAGSPIVGMTVSYSAPLRVVTDEAVCFGIEGLEGGTYTLYSFGHSREGSVDFNQHHEVVVADGETVELDMAMGAP